MVSCRNVVARNPELGAAARIEEVQGTPEPARRVAQEIVRRILRVERRVQADRKNNQPGGFNGKAEDTAHAISARYIS
jgi:hypothetical protein